jgi:hypothetical protein
MPSLLEILKDPNYINANEATKQAIFNKYSALDSNFANANAATQDAIRQKFGVMGMPAVEEKAPTAPTTLRDVGVAGASGVVGAAKSISDVFGADNAASKALGEASTSLQGMYTPERQKEMQYYQNLQDEAAKSGDTMGEIGAAFQGIKAAPLQGAAQAVGSLIPNLATLFIPGAGQARALQISRGAVNTALGIVQGTGAVKGAIYEGVKQELMKNGMDEASAAKQAEQAQSYLGPNADQILLGAGIGYGAGKLGAEELLSPAVKGAARKAAAVASEAGTEAIQGGQEQVAQNIALQRAGIDTPTFQGVAGAATQEGILGALGAGPVTMLPSRAPEKEQGQLLLTNQDVFTPVGLPDGSVATTREELDTYLRNKREQEVNAPKRPELLDIIDKINARVGAPPEPMPTDGGLSYGTATQEIELLKKKPQTPEIAARITDLETYKRESNLDSLRNAKAPVREDLQNLAEQIKSGEYTEEGIQRRIDTIFANKEERPNVAKLMRGKLPTTETEQDIKDLMTEAKKLTVEFNKYDKGSLKGKSLRSIVANTLAPQDAFEIGPTNKKEFGYLVSKDRAKQTTLAEMMANSQAFDPYLPPHLRTTTIQPGMESDALEFIRDKIRDKDFRTYDATENLRILGNQLGEIDARIKELGFPKKVQEELSGLSLEERRAEADRLADEQGYTGAPLPEEVAPKPTEVLAETPAVEKPRTEVPFPERPSLVPPVPEKRVSETPASQPQATTPENKVTWYKPSPKSFVGGEFSVATFNGARYHFGDNGSGKYEVEVITPTGGDNVVFRDNGDTRKGVVYPGAPTPSYIPSNVAPLLSQLSQVTKGDTATRNALMDRISNEFNIAAAATPESQPATPTLGRPEYPVSAAETDIIEGQAREVKEPSAPDALEGRKPSTALTTETTDIIEGQVRVIDEDTIKPEVLKLSAPDQQVLADHYGEEVDSPAFLEKVRDDIYKFATKGAQAVSNVIRDIIRKLHAALLATTIILNPNYVGPSYQVAIPQNVTTVEQVLAKVPDSVRDKMSPGAQQAYANIMPAFGAELEKSNKLFIITDKPNARIFVFDSKGQPILDKKVLLGLQTGDYYKGDPEKLKTNRITSGGFFTMGLRDAKRGVTEWGGDEFATAHDYDFGKVFVLDKALNGTSSVTLFHSVYTKLPDAKRRLAALEKEGPEDSRYSYGCINVDKATYKYLLDKYQDQMDGAKLFIVPDNPDTTMEFLRGKAIDAGDLVRQAVPEVKKTVTKTVPGTPSAAKTTTQMAARKEEEQETRRRGLYMQAKRGEKGMSKADVDAAVDNIKSTWENAPEIEVVQSITGLPEEIQEQIKREEVNPRGVYDPDTKKVWLVADNIPTDAQAAITLAHEAFGHFGLRVALGKNFKPMMSAIFEGNKSVRDRAQEYINDGMDKTTAVEEVLSEMAQEILDTSVPLEKLRANRTALQKVMNAIRQFLARLGVPIKTIDDATVLDLIRTARHMVTEGKNVSREMVGGKPLYQQSDMFSAPPEKTTKIPTKLIKDRVPEIQQAKIDLSAGLISRDEYDRIVQEYKPVRIFDSVPRPATDEEMRNALKSNQKDRIGEPSATLKEGHPVGIRVDIDAARKTPPVQVVSVHEQLKSHEAGKSIGYEGVAVVTNATFGGAEKKAAAIAEGGGKDTIAVIKGNWKPISAADAKKFAEMAMNKPEWSQVGYDPTRHSYFYDRKTLEPIVSGDSVIMIGNMVMVKNPKYAPKSQFLFSVKDRAAQAAAKAKQAVHKAGQRREMDEEAFSDLPDDLVSGLRRTFNPENKTIVTKIEGMKDRFWQRVAQGVADQYRSIKEYSTEGYMLARMSKTIDGALEGLLFNGQVFLNDGALDIKSGTKGLFEAMAPLGKDVDRYQMWVALNRDADLVRRGKLSSIDPKLVAQRNKLAEGTINGKPRKEVYKDVQEKMNELNKSVLNVALKQGLINKEAYDIFAADINYIPFYKAMEDGDLQGAATASGLGSQYFSKELEGGERPFGDLMENTLRNWSHILSASMKNKAAAVTVEAATDMGGAYPNLKVGLEWRDGKVYSTKSGQLVGDGKLKPEQTTSGKGMIKIMMDGKPAYFEVIDELLVDAISSIGYMGPKSKFLDVARDFKNILQFGVTLSPGFKVRNLFRDSIQSMAVSGLKLNPWANIAKGWAASDRDNPAHISALAGGAIFNFGSAYEGDQSRLIKKLIKMGVEEDSILDTKEKIKSGLGKAWRAYNELGNKSEAANRMALYKQMREEGMTHLEASFYARDLLDFSMQGSWPALRMVTQVVPFLNARIQGLYKLGRDGVIPTSRVIYNTATGKPIDVSDKQKAQQFSVVTGAVIMASMLLYLAFKDDEEFKKREEWDRDNFWWFRLPGMDSAVRVPKPFEIGAFGTMAERVLEQIIDQGAEGKQFEESIKRMLSDTFAMNPTPQFIKPLIDLYANKDSFTGAPIETAGMERLSKEQRAAETTSPLAKALSAAQRFVAPKSMEMSPVQVDYAIKSYFGWLGGTVAASSHYAVMPFSKGAYPDHDWTETMSVGFIKSLPATQSKYVTAFYENNKQISQAYADMRHYAELGDQEKVQEILAEKGDLIGLQQSYDRGAKDMAKIRQAIIAIQHDETMSGSQKKEEIDRLKVLIGVVAEQLESVRKSIKK